MSLQTKARVLPNPEVQFQGTTKLNPGTTGRWDLRGKKFFTCNPVPLVSWGICILNNATDLASATNFAHVLVQTYVYASVLLFSHVKLTYAARSDMEALSKVPKRQNHNLSFFMVSRMTTT